MGVRVFMEYWALFTAIACWLAYTLYTAFSSIRNGRAPTEGTVCVLMAGQAGLAEWFLGNMYRTGAILTGRLSVVVAVEPDDGAAGIVRILSDKNDISVISYSELVNGRQIPSDTWVVDIRGMNMAQLRDGPLKTIAGY